MSKAVAEMARKKNLEYFSKALYICEAALCQCPLLKIFHRIDLNWKNFLPRGRKLT